ncbi:MAG: cytidine deaminase [Saprospiraceae bacterium]|nr:cytidine deaminase [Saprospiraceae bacterium]
MKRIITLQIPIEIYKNTTQLFETERLLLQKAKAHLINAYAPYSGFRVAAAVLLENGEILVGANQENASYPMCLCAERVALAAAHAQFPGVSVKTIAITVENIHKPVTQPAAPCGACRQVICETEFRFGNNIEIILHGETGEVYKLNSGKDLLPLSFDGSFLKD